ncbi:hypothetical protein CPB84DRAFT_1957867 [Gymnopilus junonius]|uniref:F-box domain-containing protein n=1 Tax=Gymnopilus junonius TaxID=109634 RepID=A0A9P5TTJ3_GYMJU|nr:hypothetical protein CPB84DRAFT_1957867 [Gymnopilus junonius]
MPRTLVWRKCFIRLGNRLASLFKKGPLKYFPFDSLPNELRLHCFSFLTLEALIASKAVCAEWRILVPLTDMYPPRRHLYNLYSMVIDNPKPDREAQLYYGRWFEPSFNREEYINSLLKQHHAIPEEFRIWVLEWPARLIVNNIWPGLTLKHCLLDGPSTGGSSRKCGVNWLSLKPPQLCALLANDGVSCDPKYAPSLLVWRMRWVWLNSFRPPHELREEEFFEFDCDTWLVFDEESKYFGKVLECPNLYSADVGKIPREFQYRAKEEFPDWIQYLEQRWHGIAPCGRQTSGNIIPRFTFNRDIRKIKFEVGSIHQDCIPAEPWTKNQLEIT